MVLHQTLVNRAQRVTGTENGCSEEPEKVAAFAFLYGVNSIPREVQAIVAQAAIPEFLEPDVLLYAWSRPSSELREIVRALLCSQDRRGGSESSFEACLAVTY
jgi:hypothetical protein